MYKTKCICGAESSLSIHGNCTVCGKNSGQVYNKRSEQPLEPVTKRGKRRKLKEK